MWLSSNDTHMPIQHTKSFRICHIAYSYCSSVISNMPNPCRYPNYVYKTPVDFLWKKFTQKTAFPTNITESHKITWKSVNFRHVDVVNNMPIHYCDVIMGASLKSLASRLFTQPFIQAQIKENIKAPRHWPVTRKTFPFDDVITTAWKTPVSDVTTSWQWLSFIGQAHGVVCCRQQLIKSLIYHHNL